MANPSSLEDARQKLIEAISAHAALLQSGNFTENLDRARAVKSAIDDLLTAAAQPEWQDIATAPKDGTAILCYREGKTVFGCSVTNFDGHNWITLPGRYSWKPTHWMPLPKPPVEES